MNSPGLAQVGRKGEGAPQVAGLKVDDTNINNSTVCGILAQLSMNRENGLCVVARLKKCLLDQQDRVLGARLILSEPRPNDNICTAG